uniref:Uncharacterized protein n=1 Tax=Arundo donax TaxID=35708 RepID=A0A0A9DRJ4_ARUDO
MLEYLIIQIIKCREKACERGWLKHNPCLYLHCCYLCTSYDHVNHLMLFSIVFDSAYPPDYIA